MNPHDNIQFLFSSITVANIRQYLLDRGWQAKESQVKERLYFERTAEGSNYPSTLWTWASVEHARFRSQVPNLIFSLSVMENRPALDIANEMYSSREPEPVEPAADRQAAAEAEAPTHRAGKKQRSKLQRCVLKMQQATTVTLVQPSLSESTAVDAGDVVELAYMAGDAELKLELGEATLQASLSGMSSLKLLQGVARPYLGERWSATRIVNDEFSRLEDSGHSKAAAVLLDQSVDMLKRIDFELDASAASDAGQQNHIRRQAALLAVGLTRILPNGPASKKLLWNACAKLVFPVGLRLELNPTSIDELFETALEDDEFSPKKTLFWLKEHAVAVAGDA